MTLSALKSSISRLIASPTRIPVTVSSPTSS